MNKQLKVLVTFLSVIAANCLYAGFLDGLKKMGEGVVDVAGGVVDTTVNATTSVVQSVKQQTVFADPQTNVAATVQTVPAVTPAPAPSVATTLMPKATTIENSVAKNGSTTIIQDNASYAKDRADLEKRLQSFRFREDYQSIESVSEKNRIANRVNVAKSNLMSLPHKAEGNASRQLRKILDEEAEIVATVKEVLNKESEERIAREKTAAEARELAAQQRAEREAREKAERKANIVTVNDDISSGNEYRAEKKHLDHSQVKRDDQSADISHDGKKSGNNAMSVYQQFINDEFKTKIKVIEQELARRERAFRETYWFNGVYSHKELGDYESGRSKLALKRLREIANGDDAEFRKLQSDIFAWSYAGKSLMQPWNYCWSLKRREPYFSQGNGRFCIHLPDNPDASLPYLDEEKSTIGSLDNLSNWIERTKAWLARESEIVYKECSISELSAKRIAELHGRPDYKPFTVYKDIAFGDSVIDVFEKLKKVDNDAQWIRATRNDNDAGETIDMYLHGKRLYTEVLSRHGLNFTFGSFASDEGSVLTGMEMKFATSPSADTLVAKYNVDGAKVEKVRDIIDRKWPETEMGQFGLMLFNALERKAKAVEGKNGTSSIYRKDMLAISENHCKGKAVEKTVVTIDGVTVSICENVETHKVVKVTFEDTLLAAKLKELCVKQKETDAKSEAEAKAAAEKTAKSDSLNF